MQVYRKYYKQKSKCAYSLYLSFYLKLTEAIKQLSSNAIFNAIYNLIFKIHNILNKQKNNYLITSTLSNHTIINKNTAKTYFFFKNNKPDTIERKFIEYIQTDTLNDKNFNLIIQYLQKTYDNIASYKFKVENLKTDHIFKKNELLTFSTTTENYYLDSRKIKKKDTLPLVSIIFTAYNEQKTIEQSIDSIQNQTHNNIEIIIVDDCSSDLTSTIIEKICQNDSRIKYYKMKNNQGTYYCRNFALSKVKGDYVTFHDANDISRHDRIEKCLTHFDKENNLDFVYAQYIRIDSQGYPIKNWYGSVYRKGLITLFLKTKSLKEKIGYFDLVKTSADSEFFERLKHLNLNHKKLNDVLYYARSQEDSLTGSGLFQSFNKKGVFISNPLRRQYYIYYKIYHKFNTQKDLYLKPFDHDRNFSCPLNMLSPIQKNTLNSLINFKKSTHHYVQKKSVELLSKNKLLKRKSLYCILKQQHMILKKVHVILYLNNIELMKHCLNNFIRQTYENKYLIIIHNYENAEINKQINHKLSPKDYHLIKSSKNNISSTRCNYIQKNVCEDEIIAYFNENDFYFEHYLTEQSSVLNILPEYKVYKEPFLKYIRKSNSFTYLKSNKQLYLSKNFNNKTLCFTKNVWLEENHCSFKENKSITTSAFNYIENFQLDNGNNLLLENIPRFK